MQAHYERSYTGGASRMAEDGAVTAFRRGIKREREETSAFAFGMDGRAMKIK